MAVSALDRAPARLGPRGQVLGLDWPAALAIADALGLDRALAVEYLDAGELGMLEGLMDVTPEAAAKKEGEDG